MYLHPNVHITHGERYLDFAGARASLPCTGSSPHGVPELWATGFNPSPINRVNVDLRWAAVIWKLWTPDSTVG